MTRVKASPFARRLAAERDLDLTALQGSGPDGRVIARDIERHQPRAPHPVQPDSGRSDAEPRTRGYGTVRMQLGIAGSETGDDPEPALRQAIAALGDDGDGLAVVVVRVPGLDSVDIPPSPGKRGCLAAHVSAPGTLALSLTFDLQMLAVERAATLLSKIAAQL